MLHEPLIRELKALRLNGMAAALAHQGSEARDLDFDERLGLLIQHELTERASARLAQRLRWAKCRKAPSSKTSTPAPRVASIRASSPRCVTSPGSKST